MHTSRISLSKPQQRMFRDTTYEDARPYVCSVVLNVVQEQIHKKQVKETQAQKCCKENLLFPSETTQGEIKARWGDKSVHTCESSANLRFLHALPRLEHDSFATRATATAPLAPLSPRLLYRHIVRFVFYELGDESLSFIIVD